MFAQVCKPALLALATALPIAAIVSDLPVAENGSRLEGVWEIHGSPDPASGIAPFVNVVTIAADGKVTNVDPEVGTAVGEAFRLHGDRFAIGFFGFLDVGVPARYEVQSTVSLDHLADTFAGPFRTVVTGMNGQPLFDYKGVVAATRISAHPY